MLPRAARVSGFKKASVSRVVPIPDVPPGHDFKSSEYVFLELEFGDQCSWISIFLDRLDVIRFHHVHLHHLTPKFVLFDIRRPVPGGVAQLGSGNRGDAAAALIQNTSFNGLEPAWVRLAPPRLPVQEGEVCI